MDALVLETEAMFVPLHLGRDAAISCFVKHNVAY